MKKLASLTFGVLMATAPLAAFAHGNDHEAGTTHSEPQVAAPTTSAGDPWQEITSLRTQTEQAVKDNNLVGLHDLTDRLSAELSNLKGSFASLDEARRLRAVAAAEQAIKATDELHTAADSKDAEAVTTAATRQGNALKLIAAFIPQ